MSVFRSVMYCCVLITIILFSGVCLAGEYQHTINADKMTFAWSLEGERLAVKISAPTKGWVGIGFNPSNKMKDADFIVGYVKGGEVTIADEFGTQAAKHAKDTKKGGTDNVTVVGGSEQGKVTTLEFTIPLNSGDKYDATLDPKGDTVVLLAHGPDRDSTRMKHSFHKVLTVNLTTGAVK